MDDEFRFQVLDPEGPSPKWVPDDKVCVWAWVFRSDARVGVVWACQNQATGFIPDPLARGNGHDFDFEWMKLCLRFFHAMTEDGRVCDFQVLIRQLADLSEMFRLGTRVCSVAELRQLLDDGALEG